MMNDDPRSLSSVGGEHPRGHWGWRLAASMLIAGTIAAQVACRPPPPPPPVVDTAGFDPVIAAAIEQERQRVLSTPNSADARGQMGMVLLAHDVHGPAGECFLQASALAPREPRWLYLLGLAQLKDNPAAAATNFDRAVRLFPEDQLVPRVRLADTLLALGRTEEAEAQYRAILKREPNSARARLGLGKTVNARGLPAEAAELLSGATRDLSTRKAAHRLLVTVYQRLGRTQEAEQLARVLADMPADQSFPDPFLLEVQRFKTGEAAWIDIGDEWIKTGRLAEAADLLERTVQTYPKSDRAMFLLGRARYRLGDPAGAEAMLKRSIQLAPDSVEAHVQLGVVQLAQNRAKDAQLSFRQAIKAKPNVAEAWFNLGLSLGSENHADSAAAFREAIRLKPGFPEAYLALAVVLRADGKKQAAAQELRNALALRPEETLRQKLVDQLKLIERVDRATPE